MPRSLAFLLILAAVLMAATYFFSTQAAEVPTKTIETETGQTADAS